MIRGDHFEVSVTSNTTEHLEAAIKLVFAEVKHATHYKVGPDKNESIVLVLGRPYDCHLDRYTKEGWTKLPYPLDVTKAVSFVQGWLDSVERDGKNYPDIDGSVRPDAFTVKSVWEPEIICKVIPTYSIYSK